MNIYTFLAAMDRHLPEPQPVTEWSTAYARRQMLRERAEVERVTHIRISADGRITRSWPQEAA